MSDLEMTADTGAEQAAPEVAPAPEPVATPKPVETSTPTEAPVEKAAAEKADKDAKPEKPISTRDALKAAAEKVDKDEKAPAVKADPKAKAETPAEARQRAADGKFASKEPAQAEPPKQAPAGKSEGVADHREPPHRFNEAAKAEWANIPETTRAEVHRAIKNIESGFEKHKASAEAYEAVKDYDELSRQNGVPFRQVLDNYMQIERDLQLPKDGGNPIAALEKICQAKGYTLQQVAESYLNRTPDQKASQSEQVIAGLRSELAQIKQQLGGVTQVVQGQRQESVSATYSNFVESLPEADRSLVEVLSNEIAAEIANNGLSLPDAYAKAKSDAQEKAHRLGFVAQTSAAPAADLTAHRQNGSRSISGAPSPGSSSVAQKPSSTTREALKKAFAAAG